MSSSVEPRTPCIVGTARQTWRDAAETPEPLDMWLELARAAVDDARNAATGTVGSSSVLSAIDDLGLVHCQSWYYDDPVGRLAQRLDLPRARREMSILAGTSPQRLLDGAAVRMLTGETSVALVVGGEALAARKWFDRDGDAPRWSHPHPNPPTFPVALDEWYLPTEIAHGVLPAWLTFALLEQARWAERAAQPSDRQALASLMERLNRTAAANPGAWFGEQRSADELTRPAPGNRMIATPYTKRMTAFLDVDMAAANLMVTTEIADEWGIPPERRVYLRGWGFARDAVHLAERDHLGSSPAMRAATSQALAQAHVDVDEIGVFDLYSCFGSAVEFALDALGIDADDARDLTVTGGLPYHGGPGSNYMSHSISHMVDRLRERPGLVGMVTGVGMHMTKHVAGVWSTQPGHLDPGADSGPQQWSDPATDGGTRHRTVVAHANGSADVLAASVVYPSETQPPFAVAICELADRTRCYARSDDPGVVNLVADDAWVGTAAHVEAFGDVNRFKL